MGEKFFALFLFFYRSLSLDFAMYELSDNIYNQSMARNEPKLKLWRYAGLMITYKCPASCEFCYYNCSPQKNGLMPLETALSAWQSLETLAGENAKVHITGGEPFLYFDHVADILTEAKNRGLRKLDSIETNAYWATDHKIIKDRVNLLNSLGVARIKISWDPFHAEFIDVNCVRRLKDVASEIMGPDRVLVRWQEYLDQTVDNRAVSGDFDGQAADDRSTDLGTDNGGGANVKGMPDVKGMPFEERPGVSFEKRAEVSFKERAEVFLKCVGEFPARYTGRGGGKLAELVANRSVESLEGDNCRHSFLSAKGVHIDPFGNVFSGLCSGIIVGNVEKTPLEDIWAGFDPANAEFIGGLFAGGPKIHTVSTENYRYNRKEMYADKCHLCTEMRQFFFDKGKYKRIIGPCECYKKGAMRVF
jgi:MoaA/NifB/PqqE/SkfB family radical SAM enzyme